MKKILLILALLLPALSFADRVPQEQARKIAEQFFATTTSTRAVTPDLTLKWTGDTSRTRATAEEPAFYVFNNSAGGFVIVAGDESVEPILGYSHTGAFVVDGMPDNVKYWFSHLHDGIAYLRSQSGFTPSAKVQSQWRAARSGTLTIASTRAGAGKELSTAQWNQYAPYNTKASDMCSKQWGKTVQVYTGCVATATAIIMRYHQYPTKGVGTLPDYTYESEKGDKRSIKGYALGQTYDWANMPLTYNSSSTAAQNNAVAQLMMDCGVMAQMQYGIIGSEGGSGAITSYVPERLVEYMGYDLSHDELPRHLYSRDEWVGKIVGNIDNNCPVLFSGTDASNGGHAFILDGYDNTGKIHVNFGWGGQGNGYFAVPDFGDYKFNQSAFINIKPNAGGTAPAPVIYQSGLRFSVTPKLNRENRTVSMTIATKQVGNGGVTPFSGKISLAHTDKNGNFKNVIGTINSSDLKGGYFYYDMSYQYEARVSDISDGDKIKWFYLPDGESTYLPVRYDLETATEVNELPLPALDDIFNIDDDTSLRYLPNDRKLIITTHTDVTWSLESASGAKITSGVDLRNGVLTIDLEPLSAGEYKLTLKVGKSSRELPFTVGK